MSQVNLGGFDGCGLWVVSGGQHLAGALPSREYGLLLGRERKGRRVGKETPTPIRTRGRPREDGGVRGRFPRREYVAVETRGAEDDGLFGRRQGPGGLGHQGPRAGGGGFRVGLETFGEDNEITALAIESRSFGGRRGFAGRLHVQIGGCNGMLECLNAMRLGQQAFMMLRAGLADGAICA